MSSAPTLLHKSHVVSSDDYCSGYVDALGKWNTGFPCPWTDTPRFCCGTDTFKYCCSGQEKASTTSTTLEDPLLLVLAITLGVAAGVTLLTLVACFVCPGCLLHKKRRPGPMYRLPCSSTMSSYATTANTSASAGGPESGRMCSTSGNFSQCGPVPSIYSSLSSDPLCRSSPSNEILHHQQQQQSHHQPPQQMSLRDEPQRQPAFHHLYWNRASPPRLVTNPARIHHQGHHHQHQPLLRHYHGSRQGDGGSSPPPPYEANFQPMPPLARNPAMVRVTPPIRSTAAMAHGRPRPAAQEAIVRHISPRQPAVCIIEDGHRDHQSDVAYRSTKF